MQGFVRQLFDYDGSNLYPITHPAAFVSSVDNTNKKIGIRAIGELVQTITPDIEPEFMYRINGNESGVAADASGQICAIKLSDASAFFNFAKLTQPITVANPMGDASEGKVYGIGTSLEEILRDILEGPPPVHAFDVITNLVDVSLGIIVSVNGVEIMPTGNSYNVNENTIVQIGFDITYSDGYFSCDGVNYTTEKFDVLHGSQGTFDSENHRLYGDTSALALSLSEMGNIKYNADSSMLTSITAGHYRDTSVYTYIVRSNPTAFTINLDYSGQDTGVQPYMSNGANSAAHINTGSKSYNFYIQSLQVYDVNATAPSLSASTLTPNTDFVLTSYYDANNNTNTGLWVDDSVYIKVNKQFSVNDGYFTPQTGYSPEDFVTQNQGHGGVIVGNKLLAQCNPVSNGLIVKLNNNTSTNITYNCSLNSSTTAWNYSFTNTNTLLNGVLTNGSNTITIATPHNGNSIYAYKSDGTQSNVNISSKILKLDGNINALADVDVTATLPSMSISRNSISINDASIKSDGTIIGKYPNNTISGTITFNYLDGNFKPSSSSYTDASFEANNNVAEPILPAGCELTGATCYINGSSSNTSVNISNRVVTFTNITLPSSAFDISIGFTYGNSQKVPKKLSNRPSSVNISSGSAFSSTVRLKADTQVNTYQLYILSNTQAPADISNNYTKVTDIVNDASTTQHWNKQITGLPNTVTGPVVSGIGKPRKTVIAIAPEQYNEFNIIIGGTPLTPTNTVKIQYSNEDNTPYKMFIIGRAGSSGYNADSIEVKK